MKLFHRTYSSGKQEELYQPPIIILHGMGLSGSTFKNVAPTLAKRTNRKVYVPDIRNHGKSLWANEMNYDVLTNDILEFMQENDIPKAILIGNSMGGRIAMNIALKYPHKVDALVIEDMTPRNVVSSGFNVLKFLLKAIQDILDDFPPDTETNKVKRDLVERMLNLIPVYVPDIRNHGKSPWAKEMNYDVLTNDILEFMQENNIPKAIFIGNSMGGRIAMNIALKYPHKVDALVIEDMTPRNVASSRFSVASFMLKALPDILDAFPPDAELNKVKRNMVDHILNFVPHLSDKDKVWKNYDPDYVAIVKEGDRLRPECNVDAVTDMIENDALVQNLPDLDVTFSSDALFLYGSKGFFNLGKDPSIKKLFPKAIIRRIDGASHFIHIDSSDVYTNIIADFILHRNLPQSKY